MTTFDYCMCIIASVFLVVLGVLRIRKLKSFKTEVRAVFVKYVPFRYKGTVRYSPMFKYKFESTEIIKESFQRFDKKELPLFIKGKTYSVFINEKSPEQFVIDRKTSFWDILLVAVMLLTGFSALVILFISLM